MLRQEREECRLQDYEIEILVKDLFNEFDCVALCYILRKLFK